MVEREGFVIRCESETGDIGWGEASPHPGYTRECTADAERSLRRIPSSLPTREIHVDEILSGSLATIFPAATRSVLFGLETACLNLLAGRNRGFRNLLSEDSSGKIFVNGLLPSLFMPSEAEPATWAANGMRVIKCKVGRGEVDREREWIRSLADMLPPEMKLRLDANRGWSLAEATAFCEGLPPGIVEYVEEPLREISELTELAKRTDVPIALDETVQEMGEAAFELGITPAAMVLKPGALRGISAAIMFGRKAIECGAQPVVSSLYESGLGMLALAQLAAFLGGDRVSCGLDTHRVLKEDTLVPRFSPSGWEWDLEEMDAMGFSIRENIGEELSGG